MPEKEEIVIPPESYYGYQLLDVGDQMGSYVTELGMSGTRIVQNTPSAAITTPVNTDYVHNMFGHERAVQLSSPAFIQILEDLWQIDISHPNDLMITPIKHGIKEVINKVSCGIDSLVMTFPQPLAGDRREFQNSISSMSVSSNNLPGFLPQIYYHHTNPLPYALMENVADGFEETNIFGYGVNKNVTRQPGISFLSNHRGFAEYNYEIGNLDAEEIQLLTAYFLSKSVAALSLMCLSTVSEGIALTPADPSIGAGDFTSRVTETGLIQVRPITFRGGARGLRSLDQLVQQISLQTDYIYRDLNRDKATIVSMIPQFDEKEAWIRSVVEWTANVYLATLKLDYDRRADEVSRFISQSGIVPAMPVAGRSPYTVDQLKPLANVIDFDWMRGDR